jgi:hypothetical protein
MWSGPHSKAFFHIRAVFVAFVLILRGAWGLAYLQLVTTPTKKGPRLSSAENAPLANVSYNVIM